MARYEEIQPERMTAQQKAVYEAIAGGPRGGVQGPFPVLLHNPGLASAAEKLGAYVRYRSAIPERLKELAISVIGRFWGAHFEWDAHSRLAIEAGIDPSVIDAIKEGRWPGFANADEEVIYEFCMTMLEKKAVDDETYARCLEVLGQRGLIDLAATMTHYTMIAITLNAFAVPLPEGAETPPFGPGR